MEAQEKSLVLKIVVIVCALSILGIVIIKLFSGMLKTEKVIPVNSNVDTLNSEELKNVDYFVSLIDGWGLDFLDAENNTDISNFDKISNYVKWQIASFNETSDTDAIKITTIYDNLEEAFGSTLNYKLDDIVCKCGQVLYKYDSDNAKYIYNKDHNNHLENKIGVVSRKIVNYYFEEQQYIITTHKLFYKVIDGVISNDFYGSYADAENNKNAIFSYNKEDVLTNEELLKYANNYWNDNYDTIKSKLKNYQYYFLNENGKYIINKYVAR